jgi:hypothetical protein
MDAAAPIPNEDHEGEGAEARPAGIVWAEPRNLFFFRTAKLHGALGEETCEVIALAESGAILRAACEHEQGQRATLELNSVHRFEGRIAWADGARLGLEFDDRQLVRDVLACRERSFPYRPPRINLRCELEVQLGARHLKTHSHDVSEAGIKVELPADDCTGMAAIVSLDGLKPVKGTVEWWREGRAGISFERPIPIATFAEWVTERLDRTED